MFYFIVNDAMSIMITHRYEKALIEDGEKRIVLFEFFNKK